jgi:diguanylate cyclase (GGDEF)-like protein/PAS domain S-box-containing protein
MDPRAAIQVAEAVEAFEFIEMGHETSRRFENFGTAAGDAAKSHNGQTFQMPVSQECYLETKKQAAILNGLPAPIALLDNQGYIISINEAWRQFSGSNALAAQEHAIGLNYLDVCNNAHGDNCSEALHVAQGILSVLGGETKSFSIEYPCHSPTEERWFLLMVTPFADDRRIGVIVMHLNITQQTRAAIERTTMEAALFVERERAHVTLNSIGDAVVCVDISGNITFLNQMAEIMTGWPLQKAAGRPMADVLLMLDSTRQVITSNPMQMTGGIIQNESQSSNSTLITATGKEIAIDYSVAPIHDRSREVTGAVYVFRDVSASRATSLQIAHSAHHDFLTGLPNRILLNDRIGRAIAQAGRHKKKVVILFLDLDGFKHINDSLGHPVGDKLLQSVAKRLTECTRTGDTVSRQGGDEFIVLLTEVTQLLDAATKAGRILKAIAEAHSTDHHVLHVTGSIGISVYPDDGVDAETLIKNADTAMYQAKENGRQSYRFFKPAMNVRAVERQSIEESLRRALAGQEFELHYQPKINLKTRAIIGAEALIRWKHPTRGSVPPAEFIPVAEDSGQIVPIGAWVLREACKQARAWTDAGLPSLTMAVNVSAMEFADENFLESVFTTLNETGMPASRLELELTESVLMKRAESAVSILQSLRNKGIRVAVDDFGTGYSSLSYLRKFPVDALKIDQSFTRQISSDGEDSVIVKAVIGMAHNLKLKVIAEGVETLAELQFLHAHHCDEAQGYHFSKPVPAEEFATLLKAGILAPVHTNAENNQRRHPRQKVLKDGKIISDNMSCVTDVKIRDMSASGALIRIPANVSLPESFSLLIVSERKLHSAIVRWRKGETIGIEFVGEPRTSALRIGHSHQPVDGTIRPLLSLPHDGELLRI